MAKSICDRSDVLGPDDLLPHDPSPFRPAFGGRYTEAEKDHPDFDPLLALNEDYHPPSRPGPPPRPPTPPAPPWVAEALSLLAQIRDAVAALQPAFLTTTQFADRLGVSVGSVRRMIRQRRVRATKLGPAGGRGRQLVPKAELDRLLEGGRASILDVLAAEFEEEGGTTE